MCLNLPAGPNLPTFAGNIWPVSDSNGLVIVVGSINADLVVAVDRLPRPGETVVGGRLERHGGGKGANQAVAAARAGAHVRMIGAVGDDDFGRAAVAELEAEGVDVTGVAILSGEATGVAAITVDAEGENQIAVASGANAALHAGEVQGALGRLAPGSDAVLLMNFELGDPPLEAAARWAAERRVARIVLNPAPARPLSDALLAAAPLLTPNAGELAALADGSIDDGAEALARRSGAPVIVTVGRDGALLRTDSGVTRVPAPPVRALDTTGAGDAFNGALAAALAQGYELGPAVRRAVAGASASVRARGARGGMAHRAEIDALAGG